MRVFVAGATGALGRPLVPRLVAAGHEVVGLTRSETKRELVRSLGATPAVADALDPDAVARVVAEAERAVTSADWTEGVVLRYGGFYGPGTSLGRDGGDVTDAIRQRKFPLVGDGGGIWSFIHVEDAADATVAAVEHAPPGIYNIVDDEPAPVSDWLPAVAEALGAKPPRRVPRWLGRILAGEAATYMMTESPGASNAKA